MAEATAQALDLKKFLSSMKLSADLKAAPTPMVQENLTKVNEDVSNEDRFLSGLAVLVFNIDRKDGKFDKSKIQDLVLQIDQVVNAQLNEVIHHSKFQAMESSWRGVADLLTTMKPKQNMMLDILDVSKEELHEDFENNSVDLANGALFRKIYTAEYDQFGGKPFGGIVGLYEFEYTPKDMFWLRQMGKVAAVSHSPFYSQVSPKFFGCSTAEELSQVKDLEGMLNQPKYGAWQALRDSPEAAYIGLTVPRYMQRLPWHPEKNPSGDMNFTENMGQHEDSKYLWGNSAILFAKNMYRSFESSGWCQHLRGPKGGGLVSGLPVNTFNIRGTEEIKLPLEMVIPDFRELEFANAGFIPLVYRKGSADACFFSAQSLKKSKKFKDPKDSENAQLVTNLCYTMSVARIAHYVKSIMRDNIGSTADGDYIQKQLSTWIGKYVTTVPNPDDLTLRYFPFKSATVDVKKRDGAIGWYDCQMAVLPHIQFEGMDVELRLESRL
jgi:type VI secretion system protein ImpC